jgi:hypothetical protein
MADMRECILTGLVSSICLMLFPCILIGQPVPPGAPPLVITEIFYNPPGVQYEGLSFIELRNPNPFNERELYGYKIGGDIDFRFPDTATVGPKEFVIVAKDSVLFESVFGFSAYQWYTGGLGVSAGTVFLYEGGSFASDSIIYSNTTPWPSAGNGTSIAMCIDTTDGSNPLNWAAVTNNTGIVIDGVEIHANPGEECSVDNSVSQVANDVFQIFPNPNNGSFYLNAPSAKGVISIEVLSASGQLVHAQSVSGNSAISIDLPNGVYLVRSLFGGRLYHQRLAVVR